MNYSDEIKPAKILSLNSLQELSESIYLTRETDNAYFSLKKPENNVNRCVFTLETSDINTKPTIRPVNCINKNKKYSSYQAFAIETKDKSKGIAIVLIKLDDPRTLYCNVRMLPLNTLNDIADREADTKVLTVNLEKANFVLKTDVTISPSNTGEAMYLTHDVDVNSISDLITSSEVVELKRELEYQGAKLIAHFSQEMLDIVLNVNSNNSNSLLFSEDYILLLPDGKLKDLLLATTIAGNIAIEIVGDNAIKDINKDWTAASSFLGYLL